MGLASNFTKGQGGRKPMNSVLPEGYASGLGSKLTGSQEFLMPTVRGKEIIPGTASRIEVSRKTVWEAKILTVGCAGLSFLGKLLEPLTPQSTAFVKRVQSWHFPNIPKRVLGSVVRGFMDGNAEPQRS